MATTTAITAIGQIQRALASSKRTRGCLIGADPGWIPEDDDLSCRIFKRVLSSLRQIWQSVEYTENYGTSTAQDFFIPAATCHKR
jgi:hypothetical protein